jgi:hypothetical protein
MPATRGALCGTLHWCGASACVIVYTTSVPILESDGEHAPYCNNDCLYRHATRRKQKLKLLIIRSVKFYACGLNPRAWANPCDTKYALNTTITHLMLHQLMRLTLGNIAGSQWIKWLSRLSNYKLQVPSFYDASFGNALQAAFIEYNGIQIISIERRTRKHAKAKVDIWISTTFAIPMSLSKFKVNRSSKT